MASVLPPAAAAATTSQMTAAERRATLSLAALFGLRMLGLFLILPVFAVAARQLPGGDSHYQIGLAMGIYGLTQAFLQWPVGWASDRYGRRRVVLIGLAVFIVGSVIAALATTLTGLIVGRAVQGAGAISAAITAWLADLTRPQVRTKAMALIGGTIGLSFAISLIAAPGIVHAVGLSGLFWTIAALASAAWVWAARGIPVPESSPARVAAISIDAAPTSNSTPLPRRQLWRHPDLMRLNAGVFSLHAIQMALFVVVPPLLVQHAGLPLAAHWKLYLPVVLLSFVGAAPLIMRAEQIGYRRLFVCAIAAIAVGLLMILVAPLSLVSIALGLGVFFVGFNVLEASLPSLVSRFAPTALRGAALGGYNTLQSLGLFSGGAVGGGLATHFGASSVLGAMLGLTLVWALASAGMREPPAPEGNL